MKKLTIVIRDAAPITTWLGLMDSEHLVSFNVETIVDPEESTTKKKREVKKGRIVGRTAYHAIVEGKRVGFRFSLDDAVKILRIAGYAENTASATLSRAVAHGFVKVVAHGRYEIIKEVPEKYSFLTIPSVS